MFSVSEEQLDFPVLYASAKEGWASTTYTKDPPDDGRNMSELLDAIVRHVPPPTANVDAPFQMLVGSPHLCLIMYNACTEANPFVTIQNA